MQRGKIYFSIGEEAIIDHLKQLYGITELQAIEHVIRQKRELAFIHNGRGNVELAQQILSEIGEGNKK